MNININEDNKEFKAYSTGEISQFLQFVMSYCKTIHIAN